HLTGRHMTSPIVEMNGETGEFSAFIGPGREWRESEMLEAVNAFIEATQCLLHLCWSWHRTKEQGRMSPDERAKLLGVEVPDEFRSAKNAAGELHQGADIAALGWLSGRAASFSVCDGVTAAAITPSDHVSRGSGRAASP